jgi:hypothetical protein
VYIKERMKSTQEIKRSAQDFFRTVFENMFAVCYFAHERLSSP